ncbi:UDP-galactose/UDP-glucose transporter 5 isoform X2 [Physcomitrium patens]|uniref:UDP-galactose/UDP-glucose transporter 5 isoform X2 n=1 Tax=Physcomitrium patens TaxID=3218 RepID=UPI000D167501|nr:UDP-galactose/UDP-glucose transporter 5B-like isoform X2 [Physcomitrium patens]|eukprot:XP_024396870.1 UDP-galactose/UDP-glucose transporter 5B-like isoform X2 [Physcomitrella patens]
MASNKCPESLFGTQFEVLAAAQSYEDNHVNFTQYGAFSKLCGSSATCAVAGVLLLVQGKKYFTMRASLHAYAVIATAAAIAVTAENQLSLVGEEWSLTWQCLIVVIVMGLQMAMMDIEFSRRDWLVSGLFICGCFVSALPWLPSKTINAIAPWYLAFGGIFAAVVYLGMEGLNQTYQDKLFRKLDTAITEQVFFISLFATVIRIIGFLWEFRCLEAISFHAKHPFSFASVLLLSFMGVVMTFLMSYMLRLCGALICVMIHQIMVNILAGKSQELNFVNNVFKWIGIIFMLGMLGTTMSMMQHNHQKCDKIQLTDEEMDEFEVEDESLLQDV